MTKCLVNLSYQEFFFFFAWWTCPTKSSRGLDHTERHPPHLQASWALLQQLLTMWEGPFWEVHRSNSTSGLCILADQRSPWLGCPVSSRAHVVIDHSKRFPITGNGSLSVLTTYYLSEMLGSSPPCAASTLISATGEALPQVRTPWASFPSHSTGITDACRGTQWPYTGLHALPVQKTYW